MVFECTWLDSQSLGSVSPQQVLDVNVMSAAWTHTLVTSTNIGPIKLSLVGPDLVTQRCYKVYANTAAGNVFEAGER